MDLSELDKELAEVRGSLNPVPVAQLEGRTAGELSEAERLKCAHDFFQTGNLSQIARERGVAYNDLLDMARQSWWEEEVKNLEREANALLKVKLNGMLGKSLEKLEQCIDHGDLVWKDQGLRRVPVPARDLAVIASTIFSKKKELEESGSGFGTSEAKRLLNLAAALRARDVSGEVYDAEVLSGPQTKA